MQKSCSVDTIAIFLNNVLYNLLLLIATKFKIISYNSINEKGSLWFCVPRIAKVFQPSDQLAGIIDNHRIIMISWIYLFRFQANDLLFHGEKMHIIHALLTYIVSYVVLSPPWWHVIVAIVKTNPSCKRRVHVLKQKASLWQTNQKQTMKWIPATSYNNLKNLSLVCDKVHIKPNGPLNKFQKYNKTHIYNFVIYFIYHIYITLNIMFIIYFTIHLMMPYGVWWNNVNFILSMDIENKNRKPLIILILIKFYAHCNNFNILTISN